MANKKDLSAALSQRKNIPPLQRGKGVQISSDELQQSKNAEQLTSEAQIEQSSRTAHSQFLVPANIQPSDNADSQFRKDAKPDVSQYSINSEKLESGKVAKWQSEPAKMQTNNEAIVQISNIASPQQDDSHQSLLAEEQDSEITDQQLREIAKMLQKVIAKEQDHEKAKQRKEDPADLLIQSLADMQISFPELEQFRKLAVSQRKKVNQGVTIPESLFSIYKSCAMGYTLKGKKVTMGDLMAKALIKYLIEEIIPELVQE